VDQTIVVELIALRAHHFAKFSLSMRMASSASGVLAFPVVSIVTNRTCVDREVIEVRFFTQFPLEYLSRNLTPYPCHEHQQVPVIDKQ